MSAQKPAAGAGACSSQEKGSRTPLERPADAAKALYHLRVTFFPQDPAEKAAALRAGAALALLDALFGTCLSTHRHPLFAAADSVSSTPGSSDAEAGVGCTPLIRKFDHYRWWITYLHWT
jgi:hypothetical protein